MGLVQGSDLRPLSASQSAASVLFICADTTVRCPTCRKNKCKPQSFSSSHGLSLCLPGSSRNLSPPGNTEQSSLPSSSLRKKVRVPLPEDSPSADNPPSPLNLPSAPVLTTIAASSTKMVREESCDMVRKQA